MIILFVWVSICSWASALPRVPRVTAKAAVVYDVNSGMYLFDKNGGVPMYPASTVKLLTAMVILDKWDPEYKISIPGSVKEIEPFKLYLKRGETYKVIDLLYALLMRSANDVAHALGVRAGGSEKRFAKLMMKKAQEIGAIHCVFRNPHGLPNPEQVVTAREMALVTAYSRRYPLLRKIMSTVQKVFPGPGKTKTNLINRNKLLTGGFRPMVLGKTGFTQKAGTCFVGYTTGVETPVVIVLYNSPARWEDLKKLAKWGDNYYRVRISENKLLLHPSKVPEIQKKLNRLGYLKKAPSGIIDVDTVAAILKFQSSVKINPDGIMGPKTLALLYKRSSKV